MYKIIQGDNLIELKSFEDNSVDSIVTDPPYELGFMGKSWDNTGIANNPEMWKECLRVLKPGGYLLSFGGTRTYHRMAVAIEDAGFEVRDMIEWVYGSGFPKSLNIGKAIDKMQGNEREIVGETRIGKTSMGDASGWDTSENMKAIKESGSVNITKGTSEWEGWGTALKPAHEPICMARKPLAEKTVAENVLKYGTGGINIDESRVETNGEDRSARYNGKPSNSSLDNSKKGTVQFGDRPEVWKAESGRFPANLIHDNSEEVRECFPEAKGANSQNNFSNGKIYRGQSLLESETKLDGHRDWYNDNGNASRFFKSIIYQAKASKSERNKGCENLEEKEATKFDGGDFKRGNDNNAKEQTHKNNHPTVKPIALMEYLIKMVTPKGGIVLDPFMGSGSTGKACKLEGFDFIGIELDADYCKIAEARINYA